MFSVQPTRGLPEYHPAVSGVLSHGNAIRINMVRTYLRRQAMSTNCWILENVAILSYVGDISFWQPNYVQISACN